MRTSTRIPVKGSNEGPPYSIDDNLWGRSSEGREIETLDEPPSDEVFQLVTHPREAPDEAQRVTVGFEGGVPVSLDGERLAPVELIERAGAIGARHGIGIVDHIEDRIVGLKVRDLYEVPAAALLLTAHGDLEKLVSTIHQNEFKHILDRKWAYLVYAGLWLDPLRHDLDAYMLAANERVTGEITLELYKGSARVVSRSSPFALYDESLASFGESGGRFSQSASPGFIELHTLQSRMAHRITRAPQREGELEMSIVYEMIGRTVVQRRLVALRAPDPDCGGGRARRSRRRRIPAQPQGSAGGLGPAALRRLQVPARIM